MSQKLFLDGIFDEDVVNKPPIILCFNYLYCSNSSCKKKHYKNRKLERREIDNIIYLSFNKNLWKTKEKSILDEETIKYINGGYKVIIR